MFKKIWALYKEYEEIINYIITGAFGTVVNIGTFSLARMLNFDITISNIAAWVITVIFIKIYSYSSCIILHLLPYRYEPFHNIHETFLDHLICLF